MKRNNQRKNNKKKQEVFNDKQEALTEQESRSINTNLSEKKEEIVVVLEADKKKIIITSLSVCSSPAASTAPSPLSSPSPSAPSLVSSSSPLQEGETCIICTSLLEITSLAVIESCQHRFCCICIKKWRSKRWECPLCLKKFSTLLLNFDLAGQFQTENLPPPVIENDESTQFDCLESSYFLEEIDKLLITSEKIYLGLSRGRTHKKSWDTYQEGDWILIDTIIIQLRSFKKQIEGENFFEHYLILQELYQIQDSLNSLSIPASNRNLPQAKVSCSHQSEGDYSNYDHTYEEEEYWDQDEEDDYYDDNDNIEDWNGRSNRKVLGKVLTSAFKK